MTSVAMNIVYAHNITMVTEQDINDDHFRVMCHYVCWHNSHFSNICNDQVNNGED